MSDERKLKALWAINPFEEERSTLARAGAVVRQAVGDRSIELEPVYVMSPRSLGISPELSGSVARYRLKTREGLNRAIKQCRLPGLKPVQVLLDGSGTLTDNVSALLKYAERTGAGLIVVSTHSRRGLSRLLLGSFAETLLQRSQIPVLTIGPRVRERPLKKILFPTADFTVASFRKFRLAAEIAHRVGAKLVILHSVPHPVQPIVQSGVYLLGGGWIPVSQFLSLEEERQERQGKLWVKRAQAMGINAELIIDPGVDGLVPSILEQARKRGAQAIVMASRKNAFRGATGGSTARQVIREATCPVWVI